MPVRDNGVGAVWGLVAIMLSLALALGPVGFARAGQAADSRGEDQPKSSDEAPVVLPPVQVVDKKAQNDGSAQSGYRYDQATAGPLGQTPLKDTPYSINVTSGELIQNRAAHGESDALKTNPSVSGLMESNGYSSMSRVMIRGFSASDGNEMRDGLVDRSFTVIPFENVDRVEVMNGMSAFLNGFANPGGTVNYISKQPTPQMNISAETGFYGGGVFFGHADMGGPVSSTDGKLSFRVNAYLEGGNSYLDNSNQNRNFVSGMVKYKLSDSTTVWADFWNQYFTQNGIQSYVNVNPSGGIGVPSASDFSARKQYGQSWTYNYARKTVGGAGFESKINDTFTLRAAFRYGDMWRQYKFVSDTLTNTAGAYTESMTASPRQYEKTRSAYGLVDAKFDTGNFSHKLTFGYSGTGYVFTRGQDVVQALGLSNLNATSAYPVPIVPIGPSNQYYREDFDNLILGDKINLTEKLSILGGITYAMYNQRDNAGTWGGPASGSHEFQTAFTPSVGLMFKPIPSVTTYASYIQSLAGGGLAPSTYNGLAVLNAGQVLKPAVSNQYEAGVKATVGRLDLGAALFYIGEVNQYVNPSTLVYTQAGREVHQGLEFNATGKVTDDLSLTGGFTFLDARLEKTNNPTTTGKVPVNVPDKQARLYAEYNLPFARELTVAAGVFYTGRRYVDAQNISAMSDYTTFDAGLRYQPKGLGHDISLNLNVKNVLDKAYWSYYSGGNGGLFLGEPRTVTLSLKATW